MRVVGVGEGGAVAEGESLVLRAHVLEVGLEGREGGPQGDGVLGTVEQDGDEGVRCAAVGHDLKLGDASGFPVC